MMINHSQLKTIVTFGVLFVIKTIVCSPVYRWRQACYDEQTGFTIQTKCASNSTDVLVASGSFNNTINETGWMQLTITTRSKFSDRMQAYAAGMLEYELTKDVVHLHYLNTVDGYCQGALAYCARLENYVTENLKYMRKMITLKRGNKYWQQVDLMLTQLAGFQDASNGGYFPVVKRPHNKIRFDAMLLFQLNGELMDLEMKLDKPKHLRNRVLGTGACSAFIKLTPNNEDLVFAHDSWSTYQSMLRILKRYNFNFMSAAAKSVSMSSYPGYLMSLDDFYITSQQLAITETTIENNNRDLLKYINPKDTVPTWIRVMVATRLATTAPGWIDLFSQYNSGTYNNQWMVVDFKQFTPGKPLPKNTFWVLEQMPGLVHADDMTEKLSPSKQGYWPSYNSPYFTDIFNISGAPALVAEHGDWFSYNATPRANIFRRDQHKVQDMATLQHLMRYNDYTNDPLSSCNCTPPYSAENSISARCDLNPANGTYPFGALGHRSHGGIDMKATNSELSKTLQFVAISGPTHQKLPAFQWSKADFDSTTPHFGMPDLWNFSAITVQWS